MEHFFRIVMLSTCESLCLAALDELVLSVQTFLLDSMNLFILKRLTYFYRISILHKCTVLGLYIFKNLRHRLYTFNFSHNKQAVL